MPVEILSFKLHQKWSARKSFDIMSTWMGSLIAYVGLGTMGYSEFFWWCLTLAIGFYWRYSGNMIFANVAVKAGAAFRQYISF
jgi:hypothetical protein